MGASTVRNRTHKQEQKRSGKTHWLDPRPCAIDLEELLEQTYDPDPKVRKEAVHILCPCHLRGNYEQVWDRLIAMVSDDDVGVRAQIFHTLADGSPRERETEIIEALGRMQHDPDEKLRRRVRKLLSHYRHGGRLNIL